MSDVFIVTFLRKVMAEDPIPTLVCSGIATRGTETALLALDCGAVGIVTKPKLGVRDFLHESALMLIDMVRGAAQARVKRRASQRDLANHNPATARPMMRPGAHAAETIIVIGASTGGTEALTEILTAMPADAPGIIVVQHMPEPFTSAFANRLNDLCHIEVKEGVNGGAVVPGRALLRPAIAISQ